MTPQCRDIITGSLLGDGCLERNGSNVRLRIDHGPDQVSYVEWKYRQLLELNPSTPKRIVFMDDRTGKEYIHFRFSTRTTRELNPFHELFYRNGRKTVPPGIGSLLISALGVAVWYMDDGGRRSDCSAAYFNTQCFRDDEVTLLRNVLLRNFGLNTSTHFAAGRPRIYVGAAQFATFCELIRPHVIPDMQYKLL
jgi:hypothetical protein